MSKFRVWQEEHTIRPSRRGTFKTYQLMRKQFYSLGVIFPDFTGLPLVALANCGRKPRSLTPRIARPKVSLPRFAVKLRIEMTLDEHVRLDKWAIQPFDLPNRDA